MFLLTIKSFQGQNENTFVKLSTEVERRLERERERENGRGERPVLTVSPKR
jgi:hypothetical protein